MSRDKGENWGSGSSALNLHFACAFLLGAANNDSETEYWRAMILKSVQTGKV